MPTVVYVHQAKGGVSRSAGLSGAIWRASEPVAAMMTRPSDADRQLIKLMGNYQDVAPAAEAASASSVSQGNMPEGGTNQRKRLYIFSSRSDGQA